MCLNFPLHLVRIPIHSDGVRLIITLDPRLYGLALSSQIPLFVLLLALGKLDGHYDRTWIKHDLPKAETDDKCWKAEIVLVLETQGEDVGKAIRGIMVARF